MKYLRFIGALIAVTVTRGGVDDMALAFASLAESAKCLKVTDISLFPKRLIDVTLTPLTMLMPTEPYIDDALNMLFAD